MYIKKKKKNKNKQTNKLTYLVGDKEVPKLKPPSWSVSS